MSTKIKTPMRTKRKANGERYAYPLNNGKGWTKPKAKLLADQLREEFPDEEVQVLQVSKPLNLWAPFMTQYKYFEQRGSKANNLEMVPHVAKELYHSLPDYNTAIYFEDGNILVGSASPNDDIFVAMEWFKMYPPDDGNKVLYVNKNGGMREESNPSLKVQEIKKQVKEVKNVTEISGMSSLGCCLANPCINALWASRTNLLASWNLPFFSCLPISLSSLPTALEAYDFPLT